MAVNIRVSVVGQSNERGRDYTDVGPPSIGNPRRGAYGPPTDDPITPNGETSPPDQGVNGSWWPLCVDKLAQDNVRMQVRSTAVGATLISDWYDGASTALLDTAIAFGSQGVADKKWMAICIGQADADAGTLIADWEAGLTGCVETALGAGLGVMVGFTSYRAGADTWYNTVGSPGVNNVLAAYSANDDVQPGANLWISLGALQLQTDMSLAGLYDAAHLTSKSYDDAAHEWYLAIKAAADPALPRYLRSRMYAITQKTSPIV